MGKNSWFLLRLAFLSISLAFVHSEEEEYVSVEEDVEFEGFLPASIIAYLNNTAHEDVVSSIEDDGGPLAVQKVFAGGFADYGDYPHQVSIQLKVGNTQYCGASIITEHHLLTAAHCFTKYTAQQFRIVAGETNRMISNGNTEQVRDVAQVYVHDKYNMVTQDNDIAVVILKQPLEFNDNIRAIKLRDPSWKLPDKANVSGWGKTQTGSLSETLKVAKVPFVDHETCKEKMKTSRTVITENMICAGGDRKDACQGDSGGPLTCLKNDTAGQPERYLCGIVSFGFPCKKNRGKFPSVYTDVTKYIGWFKKFMRNWWRHYWVSVLGQYEKSRGCGAGKFRCPNNDLCIPDSFKCDGENDCGLMDDSDEQHCTSITCATVKFKCNSTRKCIPRNYVCDGDDDCGDNSDEQDC